MNASATLIDATARARTRITTGSGRTQLQLMGAQLAAGVGNLVVLYGVIVAAWGTDTAGA